MTSILQFRTARGEIISVEVDESLAQAAGGAPATSPLIAKGSAPMTSKSAGDIIALAPKSFEEAMSTLKAYAGGLEDLILGLDLTPREVSVEIGLKMTGSAGFIIAKAGAETEMKVSLTWEPRPKSPAEGTS